jgi:hypothetical protein
MCQHSNTQAYDAPPAQAAETAALLDDVDPSMPSPSDADPKKGVNTGLESPPDGAMPIGSVVEDVEEEGEEEGPISDRAIVYGATGASGMIGAVIGGPLLGLVGAGGGYYAVTRPEGSKAGEAARGLGKCTVQTYRSAKKFCKKNQVGPKMKAAGARMYEGAKEVNEKYRVTERAQAMAVGAYQATREFDRKHDVSGKVARGFVAGLNKLAGEKEGQQGQQGQIPAAADVPPAREPPATPTQPPGVPAAHTGTVQV